MEDRGKNQRLIVGPANYAVNADDDIINVDTTAGVVNLTFPNIRGSGLILSQKTFSINDIGNNASVNNINLIGAGGDFVNNGASLALIIDGVSVKVCINSQTEWLATGTISLPVPTINIYTSDGTLAGPRTVDLGGFTLQFGTGTGKVGINIIPTATFHVFKSGVGAIADMMIESGDAGGSARAELGFKVAAVGEGKIVQYNATTPAGTWEQAGLVFKQTTGQKILISQQTLAGVIAMMVSAGSPGIGLVPEFYMVSGAVGFNTITPTARVHIFETGITTANKALTVGGTANANIFEINGSPEVNVNGGNAIGSLVSIRQITGKLRVFDMYNANQTKSMIQALDNGGGGITDSVVAVMDSYFYFDPATSKAWLKIGNAGVVTSTTGALFHKFTPSANLELVNFSNGSGGGLYFELDAFQEPQFSLVKADGLGGKRIILNANGTSYFNNGQIAFGKTTATANYLVDVLGSGSTSASTALNVSSGLGEAFRIFDDRNITVGGATATRMFTILQDTAIISMGSRVGATTVPAIYLNQTTPTTNNFSLAVDGGGNTILNSNQSIFLNTDNVTRLTIADTTITFAANYDIVFGTTNGTMIGTAATQKLAFWGKTAIVQPASANQAAVAAQTQDTLTDSTGGTPSTTIVDVGAIFSQSDINNNFASLTAQFAKVKADVAAIKTFQNRNRTDQINIGLIKGAA